MHYFHENKHNIFVSVCVCSVCVLVCCVCVFCVVHVCQCVCCAYHCVIYVCVEHVCENEQMQVIIHWYSLTLTLQYFMFVSNFILHLYFYQCHFMKFIYYSGEEKEATSDVCWCLWMCVCICVPAVWVTVRKSLNQSPSNFVHYLAFLEKLLPCK